MCTWPNPSPAGTHVFDIISKTYFIGILITAVSTMQLTDTLPRFQLTLEQYRSTQVTHLRYSRLRNYQVVNTISEDNHDVV
jgi:hypothetical protein